MTHLAPLIIDLALILMVAGIVTVLCHRIHQPIVLGYLIAGILVGPYTSPILHVTDINNIFTLAELGVIFLMFSLGLEFSFRKLAHVGFSALVTGIIEVIGMVVIGLFVAKLLGWRFYDALFLGAAIAISSTTIIIKAFEELKIKHKRFAQLVFGVLIVEDLLAILLLVLLSTIVAGKSFFSTDMLWASLRLVMIVGSWFVIGYLIVPYCLNRISKVINIETLTVISVGLCLGLAVIAARLHYSVALGAFIMGSILAETPQIHTIEKVIEPLRNIFGAVFFVSVGMLINPQAIFQDWKIILLLTVVVIVAKILTSMFGAFISGQDRETVVRLGFSMAQIGEFSFITASLGLTLGVVSKSLYPIIVAVSALTTFTTPYLIRYSMHANNLLARYFPKNISFLFENYSNWIYRISRHSKGRSYYYRALVRFVLNGIAVIIIFAIMSSYVLPLVNKFITVLWLSDALVWVLSLVFSFPFICGIIFAFKFQAHDDMSRAVPLFIVPAFLALIEVLLLSIYYFENFLVSLILLLCALIVVGFFYRRLVVSYQWFEKQLLHPFDQLLILKEEDSSKASVLNNVKLTILIIEEGSEYVGKSLHEIQLDASGSVIGIERYGERIINPSPSLVVQVGDVLLVVSEKNIEL